MTSWREIKRLGTLHHKHFSSPLIRHNTALFMIVPMYVVQRKLSTQNNANHTPMMTQKQRGLIETLEMYKTFTDWQAMTATFEFGIFLK